jgi:hypothetical protein
MIAAIPAGVLYIILLKILAPSIAFVIPFPIALALAYFAWHWLDRVIRFKATPRFEVVNRVVIGSAQCWPEPSFGTVGTLAVVMVVFVGGLQDQPLRSARRRVEEGQVTFGYCPTQHGDLRSANIIILEKTDASTFN